FSGVASGNVTYNNTIGIQGDYQNGVIRGNRSYDNSAYGIIANEGAVRGNYVYNKGTGIAAGGTYGGEISNNVVYANSVGGIVVNTNTNLGGGTYSALVANNTVYQLVGDAIRILNNAARVAVRNNVLQVTAGYDINLDPTSQTGFTSDYNDLSRGNDPRAHVGFLGGVARDTLADWQTATQAALGTQQDSHSIAGNPLWVDIDGADNVLGYTTANGGYDGGRDDNFYLVKQSPAIDNAQSWYAPHTDVENFNRYDDPGTPNTGSPDYAEGNLGSSSFNPAGGTAQNFHGDNTYLSHTLPFAFPFYGTSYTTAYVSTEGFIQFGNTTNAFDPNNSDANLIGYARIAPLWDDLRTNQTGNDIFIDTSVAGQETIRWNANNKADNSTVNFSVTLFNDGRIRFNYGAGNANLTPTIGLSSGNGQSYLFSAYDGLTTLTNANTLEYTLPPGFADMGAYEFRGTGGDTTAPTITATTPGGIHTNGASPVIGQIGLTFSEKLNSIDANAPASFELRGAGADNAFDTADDIRYVLSPSYTAGSTQILLNITGATTGTGTVLPWNGALPQGKFRLTVFALPSGGIHDLSGLELDGDTNGAGGGNYVRTFTISDAPPAVNVPATLTGYAGVDLGASASFTDADPGDSWTATVDFDDGLGPRPLTLNPDKTFNLSETYISPGSHTITVKVTDGLGAFATGTISLTVGDPAGLSRGVGATYTITGPVGNKTLNVLSGNVTITPTLYSTFANLGASVAGGATLTISGNQHLGSLTLASGATAKVTAQGTPAVLTVDSLSLTGSAKLDVGSNYLVVNYAAGQGAATYAQIRSLLQSGRNAGQWNGPGIDSSAVLANPSASTSLAASDNNNGSGGAIRTTFGGQPVGANAILVRYSLAGDATLDGTVDFNDLVALAQNYNRTDGTRVWATGDFTYDGNVDFNDLVALAQNYNKTLTVFPAEPVAAPVVMPSPVTAATTTTTAASDPVTTTTSTATTTTTKPVAKSVTAAKRPAPVSTAFHATPIAPAAPTSLAVSANPNVLIGSLTVKRRNSSQPVQVFSKASRLTAAKVTKPAPAVKADDVVARRVSVAPGREVFNVTPVVRRAPAIGRIKAAKPANAEDGPVWK
ncbi:MAG TPA: hypothetical protein VH475_02245, partial [Tepidisphaeraceae bacterium]